jgi:hypothetical protein
MNKDTLNPQPEPPGSPKIDLSDLTEAVTGAVRRAIEARQVTEGTPEVFHNPRIIVGFILEPTFLNPQPLPP